MTIKGLFIIVSFVCMSFLLASPSNAMTASEETASPPGKEETHPQLKSEGAKAAVVAALSITVQNIVLAGIDDKNVYAADGRTFPISSGTKIIRNLGESRIRIAELVFRGGSLISVVIK